MSSHGGYKGSGPAVAPLPTGAKPGVPPQVVLGSVGSLLPLTVMVGNLAAHLPLSPSRKSTALENQGNVPIYISDGADVGPQSFALKPGRKINNSSYAGDLWVIVLVPLLTAPLGVWAEG